MIYLIILQRVPLNKQPSYDSESSSVLVNHIPSGIAKQENKVHDMFSNQLLATLLLSTTRLLGGSRC